MIRFFLRLFYGVHGSLKPPLRGVPCYRLRHFWWKRVNALYLRSGLPEQWWKSVRPGYLCF